MSGERPVVVLALTPVAEQAIERLLFGPQAPIEPRASVAEADELELETETAAAEAVLLSPGLSGDLRRLRAGYVDLLEQVSRTRLAHGDARGTLDLAERALALDQLNETFWRLALEAETALGLREAVVHRYEELQRILDERLWLSPAHETKTLYRPAPWADLNPMRHVGLRRR